MLDAADLGAAVVAAWPGALADAVARYESAVQTRATEAAREARTGVERSLDADAPAGSLAFLREVIGV